MFYTVGDTPAAPLLVLPARDGDPVDLTLYSDASAVLSFPDGTTAGAAAILAGEDDPDGPAVEVTLPALEQPGLVGVRVHLTAAGGRLDTFDLEPVPVQPLDGWHSLGSARAEWDGAKQLDDVRLFVLLETAKRDCVAYLPAAGTRRPAIAEREAQLLHARNRNAAARIDPASGDAGVGDYAVGPFPLDWAVKQLLRPKRRFGGIR